MKAQMLHCRNTREERKSSACNQAKMVPDADGIRQSPGMFWIPTATSPQSEEGEEIHDLATYSIGVERMLLREMCRDRSQQARSLDEIPEPCAWPEMRSDLEHRLEALRLSLEELSPDDRFLILNYYEGNKSDKIKTRKMLSELFGIEASTLRMRAMRIREKLQLCTENYMQRQAPN